MATAVYSRAVGQEMPAIAPRPAHAPALSQAGASVTASPGVLYGWSFYNAGGSAAFAHFYDKSAAPTVGTDAPVLTVGVPAGAEVHASFPAGIGFANGIGWSATAGAADNNSATAALTANAVYYN